MIIAGCSNRSSPAPVTSLSTKTATKQNLAVIEGNTYTVQAGDTLFAIAFYSGNDYRDLARFNNITAPYNIQIGQALTLAADTGTSSRPAKISSTKAEQKTHKIKVDRTNTQEYGDTKPKKPREKSLKKASSSNISVVNKAIPSTWIWPALGKYAVATVGSDGSKRGLDIKGAKGSQVVAAASGKVVYAGSALKGYGNLVIIKHNDQYLSAYAHNQSILVNEQTYVKQGEQIATMGNSGASEVMLHFEIRKKGKSVDPFRYLPRK